MDRRANITVSEAKDRTARRSGVDPRQHWIFERFSPFRGRVPAGTHADFIGTMTREGHGPYNLGVGERDMQLGPPPYDEEYFEWTDVLEAAHDARDSFTMIEFGAGYGRWTSRGILAARQCGIKSISALLVEAEPAHIAWCHEHMSDNAVLEHEYRVEEAAVSDREGTDVFYVRMPEGAAANNAREWYGQALASGHSQDAEAEAQQPIDYYGRPMVRLAGGWGGVTVAVRPMSTILKQFEFVDLVDMDIQGAEGVAVREGAAELHARVRRVHIGTHSREVEAQLRETFGSLGWTCLWDFPSQATVETPFGEIWFGDGVQSWINPRFYS